MTFNVVIMPKAKRDLESALKYYRKINKSLPLKFYDEFINLRQTLQKNLFFQIRYDNIRTLSLNNFPYVIHFKVNKVLQSVVILAIVFGKREKNTYSDRI